MLWKERATVVQDSGVRELGIDRDFGALLAPMSPRLYSQRLIQQRVAIDINCYIKFYDIA